MNQHTRSRARAFAALAGGWMSLGNRISIRKVGTRRAIGGTDGALPISFRIAGICAGIVAKSAKSGDAHPPAGSGADSHRVAGRLPIQFLVQFAGLARTTVSHASLMVGMLPVLLAAGSALFAHEQGSEDGLLSSRRLSVPR